MKDEIRKLLSWAEEKANDPNQFPLAVPRYTALAKELKLTLEMEESFVCIDDIQNLPPPAPLSEFEQKMIERDGIEAHLPKWMIE